MFFKLSSLSSLRSKISLLACLMPIFAAFLLGTIVFNDMTDLTVKTTLKGFGAETKLMASKFQTAYEQMRGDAFIASHTPPITGIIRTLDGTVDPVDGSTRERWISRLQTIFASIIEAKPYYTEMRYVSLEHEGQELVKVMRHANGQVGAEKKDLRQVIQHRYIQNALRTKKDEAYFSEVFYKKTGKGKDLIPIVHTLFPVFYEKKLFGFIIITANYEELLKKIFIEISPTKETLLINQAGDYIRYDTIEGISNLTYHTAYSEDTPSYLKDILETPDEEHAFFSARNIVYFVKILLDPKNPKSFLGIIVQTPRSVLLEEVRKAQQKIIIFTLAVITFCVFLSIYMARRLMRPLVEMTEQFATISHQEDLKLPLERKDEIGALARAYMKMTENLREEEAQVKTILDHVADGIFTINKKGIIKSFNPACERIFGVTRKKIEGEPLQTIIDKTDVGYLLKMLNNAQTLRQSVQGILKGKRKDGLNFAVDFSLSNASLKDKDLFIAVVRDVRTRMKMEELKDKFISTINHELRAPLLVITQALAQMALLEEKNLDEKGKEILSALSRNSQRLSEILDDVLDMEKIESGNFSYDLAQVDIGPLSKFVVENQKDLSDEYKVNFIFEQKCEKAFCKIDSLRFVQAFTNLLSNAAKFSEKSSDILITLDIKNGKKACLSVQDSGCGIPLIYQDKIFERFFQVDTSKDERGSSGLGLSIAQTIIRAFNGEITFKSEEGHGSIFTIHLPLQKDII